MPRNVEIKARVSDPVETERRTAALADRGPEEILQEDRFFETRAGRLKLRTFAGGAGELIYYDRPDASGPSVSDYVVVPTGDPARLGEALERACGIRGVVRKRRRFYLCGQTRIHLDRVDGLGEFVELEVVLHPNQPVDQGERIARELMATLGIGEESLVEAAYVDLLGD